MTAEQDDAYKSRHGREDCTQRRYTLRRELDDLPARANLHGALTADWLLSEEIRPKGW